MTRKDAVDTIIRHVYETICIDGFPPTLLDASSNSYGDTILAGCAIELDEGSEDEAPTPEAIAARGVVLMERVKTDVEDIIDALRNYEGPPNEG